MTEIARYLEGVKAKLDIKSDTQLAIRLGVSQAAVQKWMKTGAVPDDDMCLKIAEIAADDPAMVILLAHKSRASEATKKHWARIFKTVTAATFSLLLVAAAALPAVAAQAENLTANIHYRTRRFFKCLFGFRSGSPAFVSLLLFVFLSAALPSSSKANDSDAWTGYDTALLATSSALIIADWAQTLHQARNPSKYYESNPIVATAIGEHPSKARVNLFCGASLLANAYISTRLDAPLRRMWFGFWIVTEASVVHHAESIGITLSARF